MSPEREHAIEIARRRVDAARSRLMSFTAYMSDTPLARIEHERLRKEYDAAQDALSELLLLGDEGS